MRQYVLVDRAVLHDDQKVLVRVCDDLNVLQWIAVYQQQICKCTNLDDTKLAGIGIDKPGERHQLAIVRCRHLECFGRRVPADHLGEICSLPSSSPCIEENIGTK